MRAGRREGDPRHAATGDHDERQAGGEDDGWVGRRGPGDHAGRQQGGTDEDRRQQQGAVLRQSERGGEPRDEESATGRRDRRTEVGAVHREEEPGHGRVGAAGPGDPDRDGGVAPDAGESARCGRQSEGGPHRREHRTARPGLAQQRSGTREQ